MSISLEDVSFLLKIPVTGKVVAVEKFARYTEESRSDAIKMVSNLLGVSVEEAEEEVNISKGLTVRNHWLKSRWCPKAGSRPRNYPPVECTARAYLLYLLSCTLFADKSGSRVSIALLKLLEDLDDVGNYAWGAAALAYLYRHLGSATRVQVSQIAGYLTLLEGWVYDHFKLGLATPNAKYMDYVHPRVSRWIQKHETVANVDKLGAIRRTLDRFRPSEVTWDPYVNLRENGVVQAMAFYGGKIKYMDVVEPYHRRGLRDSLAMCNLYQILRTVHWKHTEAHLRTSTPSSMGSNKTIGSDGGTMCWRLKFGARRQYLSFWLHQTTCLGSSKCLIPLSRIRALRTLKWSPQPSQTTSYLSVIGERWTRRCDGWTSRRRCVRLSRRGPF
ncbi:hypothetical protein Scep_017010 [Stephania cephalantha]|uniref:Aminotransferase-like plant mobile domain-containing protein n=1 Tax=Stephania cephalantha TaxID=152367 RepID=A0AAP0INV7_9MAGN